MVESRTCPAGQGTLGSPPKQTLQSSQSYLVIRPLSENPDALAPYLAPLAELTGLDPGTIRQKFTGKALQVLRSSPDATALQETAVKLKDAGFPAVLISRQTLHRAPSPQRIVGLDMGRERLGLRGRSGDLFQTLDSTKRCLLVLSSLKIEQLRNRRMAKLAAAGTPSLPQERLFRLIFQGHPVMVLYLEGCETPCYVDARRFNFSTLGDQNQKAVALNFPVLIGAIQQHARETWIDTGFGENHLPFLHSFDGLGTEQTLQKFFEYAAFVSQADGQGIFRPTAAEKAPAPLSAVDNLTGLLWGGPLLTGATPPDKHDSAVYNNSHGAPAQSQSALPAPPEAPRDLSFGDLTASVQMPWLLMKRFRKFVLQMGPPFLVSPLALTALGALLVGHHHPVGLPYAVATIAIGLMVFVHAFVLLGRKRAIENCPTSRVRSMSMGLVEVKGRARQRYSLKAPFSLTDCVYYSYKRYEWEHFGNQSGYRLKQWGESGRVPFYLEDETGRALVQPEHAVVSAGTTQEMSAPFGGTLGIPELLVNTGKQKIVERVIPVGEPLYVMGFARPLRTGRQVRESRIRGKLLELKRDPSRLQEYDLDGDGTISDTEWENARREMQDAALLEGTERGRDRVCISEHPTGGLFYISDRHEEHLTRSMGWRIPLFLALGLALLIGGLALVLAP